MARFVEPTRLLFPRRYAPRYAGGLTLLVLAPIPFVVAVYGPNPWPELILPALALLVLLTAGGWLLLPGVAWRRRVAAGVGALGLSFVMATRWVTLETTTDVIVIASVGSMLVVAMWLLVRMRPGLAWVLLALPPLGASVYASLRPADATGGPLAPLSGLIPAVAFCTATIVIPAWAARLVAPLRPRLERATERREPA